MKSATLKLALAASTAMGLVSPALAQDSDDGANNADIIVTARRIEERLQDVPISITVFNQQQLAERNVTNAQDLAAFTPSLSTTTSFGTENSTFALRGFVQETGTAPSVGVYFGEVVAPRGPSQGFPAGDGAGPGMFFDLQNVQVLKGPQGTLFGRNTTGGAVLLVPQKPTDRFEGYVEASVGNFDMKRLQGVVNVPLGTGARLRVGGDWQQRDGFMENVTTIGPRDFDNTNYIALRASLVLDITPDIENYTIASYINSDTNGHINKLIIGVPPLDPFGGLLAFQALGSIAQQNARGFWSVTNDMPDPYQKMRTWQVINNTRWQVNDNLTVRNIISYAQLWTKTRTSLFGTQFVLPRGAFFPGIPGVVDPVPNLNIPFNFASIRHIPNGFSSNQATFTEEFRLEGKSGDGKLNYQTGIYYENSTPRSFIGSQSPTFIGCRDIDALVCTAPLPNSGVNYTAAQNAFRSIGVYAQATYDLTEQLKLTGGIRYTWDRVRSLSQRITYVFPTFVPNASPVLPIINLTPTSPLTQSRCTDPVPVRTAPGCFLNQTESWSAPTWLIGLDYKPTDDVMLYAKYIRGYRTGNIKSDVPIEFQVFDPEKVDTYEIGAKTSFETGGIRGNFNISGFYNNFRNQQITLGYLQNTNRRDPVTGAPLPPISVPGNAGPVNVGKSRIWGIEMDARLNLFEGFVLDGAYTYLNTRVLETRDITLPVDNAYVVSASIRAGDPLILSPEHKFTVSANYTLPLDESIGRITVGATVSHRSSQIANYAALRNPALITNPAIRAFTGGFDPSTLPPLTLLNLNFSWNSIGGGPVDLSVFATNVTNKQYLTAGGGLTGLGIDTWAVGEPRMFGARVKVRFGGE
jgi:iron complex outermembrane recepter protein